MKTEADDDDSSAPLAQAYYVSSSVEQKYCTTSNFTVFRYWIL